MSGAIPATPMATLVQASRQGRPKVSDMPTAISALSRLLAPTTDRDFVVARDGVARRRYENLYVNLVVDRERLDPRDLKVHDPLRRRVRAQIDASHQAGGIGFMLWDRQLSYQIDLLRSLDDARYLSTASVAAAHRLLNFGYSRALEQMPMP